MNSRQQIQVVALCVLGSSLLIGAVLAFMFGTAADARYVDIENKALSFWVSLGFPGMIFLGAVASFVAACVIGSKVAFKKDSKSPLLRRPGTYVIAKTAESKDGTVFDMDMYDPSELKYFIQVKFENGEKEELRTSAEIFSTTGEGMTGVAFTQGGWLASFEHTTMAQDQVKSYTPGRM